MDCSALHFNAAFIVIADDYFHIVRSQEGSFKMFIFIVLHSVGSRGLLTFLLTVVRANGE